MRAVREVSWAALKSEVNAVFEDSNSSRKAAHRTEQLVSRMARLVPRETPKTAAET